MRTILALGVLAVCAVLPAAAGIQMPAHEKAFDGDVPGVARGDEV